MSTTHTPVRQAGRRPGRTVRSVIVAVALTLAALVGVAGTATPAQAASSFRGRERRWREYGVAQWYTQTGFNGCFSSP